MTASSPPYVVDSSVVIKWFIPEVEADAAEALVAAGYGLVAPDLLVAEVGDVLWQKFRRGEISASDAAEIGRSILDSDTITLHPSDVHFDRALDVAVEYGRSFCDSLYIAMAIELDTVFITADLRLVCALAERDLRSRVRALGS